MGEDLLFVYHVSLHHEDFRKCNRNDLAILSRVKVDASFSESVFMAVIANSKVMYSCDD